MIQAAQYDVPTLLEMTGAHPRGNRHDCPKCKGFRTVAHSSEAFFCHKCQWKGNSITLAKELGVHRWLSSDEYRQMRQKRMRTRDAAQRLYLAVQSRRKDLLDLLHALNRLEIGCHKAGPTEASWRRLALTYADRPKVLSELAILESAMAADLVRFFLAGSGTRKEAIGRVLERGGFFPRPGEFVEVQP